MFHQPHPDNKFNTEHNHWTVEEWNLPNGVMLKCVTENKDGRKNYSISRDKKHFFGINVELFFLFLEVTGRYKNHNANSHLYVSQL